MADYEVMPMGQSGFIFKLGALSVAVDVIVSDLYYKGTSISRRVVPPPFSVGDCPPLSLMLMTHDHADHYDKALVMSEIAKGARVIAPRHILEALDVPDSSRILLRDYESYEENGVSIRAIPAPHMEYEETSPSFSRYLGYIISYKGISIWHAGDTIETERLIGDITRYTHPDYAIIPINGRDKEREARGVVGNTDGKEAVELSRRVGARMLVPCHFDFFRENGADAREFERLYSKECGITVPVPGKPFFLKP